MKKIILIFAILLIVCGCNNDDNNNETLPPATQTGAGTFACYVNGKPYIDKSGGWFNCYYQFVDGQYYFAIGGEDRNHPVFDFIAIASNSSEIEGGKEYPLLCNQTNNHYAEVAFTNQLLTTTTCNTNYGTLVITKLDFDNKIVSGNFEFDVIHPNTGETIQIRDGRFDTLFTQ
ncbi:PBP1b-binding outer membrane lipoprotein LpoB [Flavobacterium arsenatis]|uniref:PBP1b-binding outer membrane lipoprotein LpoB n=1 Tax=Flavobacterium arsenatis TaxID=1484332 RepID=A0ABU1TQH9_9FLAO|nr:hypothetical protein [Flavobacterium arsenatis]MDR6968235.1 PBP1b-binding outer membrane lipoprotein LpoB [Flavobacterium arsenatis]